MAITIVRLGSERRPGEGLRLGTVRRPPRGVPKRDFGRLNWYDLWLPVLAPSAETLKKAQLAEKEADWKRFKKKYRAEMARPEPKMLLELLAALSHQTNFSVGCYCVEESHCHRSVLRELLKEHGAELSND